MGIQDSSVGALVEAFSRIEAGALVVGLRAVVEVDRHKAGLQPALAEPIIVKLTLL